MFHVELAPLGGILGPLKSVLGVFWAKIPLYPYNVKTQKTHFLKTLKKADFDLLESNSRYIFLHKNKKNLPWIIFFLLMHVLVPCESESGLFLTFWPNSFGHYLCQTSYTYLTSLTLMGRAKGATMLFWIFYNPKRIILRCKKIKSGRGALLNLCDY